MTGRGRGRPARQLAERDRDVQIERVGQTAQPGARARGRPAAAAASARGRRRSRAASSAGCSAGAISRPSTKPAMRRSRRPAGSSRALVGAPRPGSGPKRAAADRRAAPRRRASLTLEAAKTSTSGPNSASSWRQMPHGLDGSAVGVTTTQARIAVSPAATAPTTALRSAQIVAPYEADSTLHPGYAAPLAAEHRRSDVEVRVRRPGPALGRQGQRPAERSNSGRRAAGLGPVDQTRYRYRPYRGTSLRDCLHSRSDSVCRTTTEPPPGGGQDDRWKPAAHVSGEASRRRADQRDGGTVSPASLARADPAHGPDARRSRPRAEDAGHLGRRRGAGLPPRVSLRARHVQRRADRRDLERRRRAEPRDRDPGIRRHRRARRSSASARAGRCGPRSSPAI